MILRTDDSYLVLLFPHDSLILEPIEAYQDPVMYKTDSPIRLLSNRFTGRYGSRLQVCIVISTLLFRLVSIVTNNSRVRKVVIVVITNKNASVFCSNPDTANTAPVDLSTYLRRRPQNGKGFHEDSGCSGRVFSLAGD